MKTLTRRMAYPVVRRACTMVIKAAVVAYILYAILEYIWIHAHDDKHRRTAR